MDMDMDNRYTARVGHTIERRHDRKERLTCSIECIHSVYTTEMRDIPAAIHDRKEKHTSSSYTCQRANTYQQQYMPESKHTPAAIHARRQTHTCSNTRQRAKTYQQQYTTESKGLRHTSSSFSVAALFFSASSLWRVSSWHFSSRSRCAALRYTEVSKEACMSSKRGLHVFQKRPAYLPKEACVSSKTGLLLSKRGLMIH